MLLVEQKSTGRDLKAAYEQAGEYFDALPGRERSRFILVSDFQTFELHDLDEREVVAFPLADLPAHAEAFGFILGVQHRTFRDQDPANIKAAELVGRLHDALAEAGHRGHDLERFLVRVDVDQFYGIELGEFPARIAETALWMMDHIMNNRLSLEFGQTFVRIPLEKSPHIVHGDALERDWSGLLPPGDCSFVFGNPPFVGAKYQTAEQRAQVRGIAVLGKSGGTLDYVAAWFIKAGEYAKGGDARISFVATNSITQDEQAAQLWPILFGRCKLEIAFAHRTFAWGSDARGKAHVHVVILGLDRRKAARPEKRLFRHQRRRGGEPPRGAVPVSVRCGRVVRPASGGAGGKRAYQRDEPIDYRLQAHRRRQLHLRRGGTRRVSGGGTGGRSLASPVRGCAGVFAGW